MPQTQTMNDHEITTPKQSFYHDSPEVYLPGMTQARRRRSVSNKRGTSSSSLLMDKSNTMNGEQEQGQVENKRIICGASSRKHARTFMNRQASTSSKELHFESVEKNSVTRETDENENVMKPIVNRQKVSELKGWLMDFEKQQKDHRNGVTPVMKKPTPAVSTAIASPAAVSRRAVDEKERETEQKDIQKSTVVSGSLANKNSNDDKTRKSPKAEINETRKSVSELKGWLVGFEQKQKDHAVASGCVKDIAKTPVAGKAKVNTDVKPSGNVEVNASKISESTPSAVASANNKRYSNINIVKNTELAPASSTKTKVPKPREFQRSSVVGTPSSYLPKKVQKISNKEVQATDDGYASVSKVSAWLANDAFSQKKEKKFRKRDPNIYKKALKFGEDEIENTQKSQKHKQFKDEIATATKNVSERAEWLRNDAFCGAEKAKCSDSIAHGAQGGIVRPSSSGVNNELTSFQQRRQMLLDREKHAAKKNTTEKITYKIKWEVNGDGQYAKKVVNNAGAPPKKTFADLP